MSSYKLQVVSSYACELAEGPHWDEKESKLYHIDLIKGHCYKLDPESKQHERLEMPDATTLIVPVDGEEGKFLISQDRTICKLNWATKELQEIVTVDTDGRDTRINDGLYPLPKASSFLKTAIAALPSLDLIFLEK